MKSEKEQKEEPDMARIAVKNNVKGKENNVFPYEMTELVGEWEDELQKHLRREVRRMELEMKRRMFQQRCKFVALGVRSATAGN